MANRSLQACALIMGPPGGGKGTISQKILKDFPLFAHLSTGDVLRHHVMKKTTLGEQAKEFMDSGSLVPDSFMMQLVREETSRLIPTVSSQRLILLDGFPRTVPQAEELSKHLNVHMALNLHVPTECIVERISNRWVHAQSGRVYSYDYNPPEVKGIDDVTGESLVQREDDKPEAVRKRLEAYDAMTKPLLDIYGGKVQTFTGTESDVIYVDVKKWLDEQLHEFSV